MVTASSAILFGPRIPPALQHPRRPSAVFLAIALQRCEDSIPARYVSLPMPAAAALQVAALAPVAGERSSSAYSAARSSSGSLFLMCCLCEKRTNSFCHVIIYFRRLLPFKKQVICKYTKGKATSDSISLYLAYKWHLSGTHPENLPSPDPKLRHDGYLASRFPASSVLPSTSIPINTIFRKQL